MLYKDDMTYCARDNCKNTSCDRHYNNIDWNTPKHKHFGASIADFGLMCPHYDVDEGNDHCLFDDMSNDTTNDSEVEQND